MLKIKISLFILLFTFLSIFSQQESINNYKYIIVPERFDFQKNDDSFQINSLTKFLFEKYGFTALKNSEIFPEDLSRNRCLALTTRMNNSSGMFGKKINFDLVNCSNVVVYSSKNATSKEKDYKKAYQQVIRKTFESLNTVNYSYVTNDDLFQSSSEPEIIEIESPQIVKEIPEVKTDVIPEVKTDVIPELKTVVIPEDKTVVIPEVKTVAKSLPVKEPKKVKSFLIAQNISNGFNLVDDTNKLQYELQETSIKNVYIVKGIDGVLIKSKNKWILEYYVGNQFIRKELNIKF